MQTSPAHAVHHGDREIETLDRLLTELCERDGITVLLVEHDMRAVMDVSEWIFVLEAGRKIAEGTPADVLRNPQVIAAYLGVPDDAQ